MSKSKSPPAEPEGAVTGEELAAAIRAIAQAAQAQAASAAQIMQVMQRMAEAMAQTAGAGAGTLGTPGTAQVSVWEDDPFSEGQPTPNPANAATVAVPVPVNNHPLLQTRILEPAVSPGQFSPGTAEFRFWVAAEALARGINFWAPLLPSGTRWSTVMNPMAVRLVVGIPNLNATYSRAQGLRFFQQVVRGITISSAESADVVCHELGHAVLDAVRPQLFSAASLETAAFHESFGDMSGILCALQQPTLRQRVLTETGGRLNTNSRLSRLAEQLGWGIRQLSPSSVDRDCLRNAANQFFYQNPVFLPPSAPANQLSSAPHSFSRVFTGAFLDALARMLPVAGGGDPALVQVSRDMGRLLVNGVRTAPLVPRYFSQVAAAMIQADGALFQGRYRAALRSGFVQHGVLAVGAAGLADAPVPRAAAAADAGGQVTYGDEDDAHTRTAADAPELPTRSVETELGTIEVHACVEEERFAVTSAAPDGPAEDESPEADAAAFVQDLLQTGRITVEEVGGERTAALSAAAVGSPSTEDDTRKTHALVPGDDGTLRLVRLHFACGFCQGRG